MHVRVHNRSEDFVFEHPGQFLSLVRSAVETGRIDDRLRPYAAAGSDEHRGDFGEHGGFLVPTGAVLPRPLRVGIEDPIASRTTPVPMDEPTVAVPARVDKDHSSSVSGGLTVSRRRETTAVTSSRAELGQVQLVASMLMGLTFSTGELADSSPRALMALLEAGFRDEMASTRLNERINGTGAGEPLGVLHAPCLIEVSKEVGQVATTIVTENIISMIERSWGHPRAVWLANKSILKQLLKLTVDVGTGGALFQLAHSEESPFMLAGRPLFFVEECPTLGTKGDLICGTWSEYLDAEYHPFQQAESLHVRYETHEKAFKFWLRGDGRPWWTSVLTPKNGSTQSPFVTLETRS